MWAIFDFQKSWNWFFVYTLYIVLELEVTQGLLNKHNLIRKYNKLKEKLIVFLFIQYPFQNSWTITLNRSRLTQLLFLLLFIFIIFFSQPIIKSFQLVLVLEWFFFRIESGGLVVDARCEVRIYLFIKRSLYANPFMVDRFETFTRDWALEAIVVSAVRRFKVNRGNEAKMIRSSKYQEESWTNSAIFLDLRSRSEKKERLKGEIRMIWKPL